MLRWSVAHNLPVEANGELAHEDLAGGTRQVLAEAGMLRGAERAVLASTRDPR